MLINNTDVLENIKTKSGHKKKYYYNENYFSRIDSEKKAYFLGFLFADGCVRQRYRPDRNKPLYSLILKLHKKDIDILRKLLIALGNSNIPIVKEKGTNCYKITVNSKTLCEDLISHGCVPRKSLILKFPTHIVNIQP